ncbi:unnamed protein product [Phytomonas sp. Hart1]|nr:unnamed protein product [Phytomonas sp. Hart1]|eukprot:CCW68252.1 unnamed protein product [Phytomonas sp. isolate Hart1]
MATAGSGNETYIETSHEALSTLDEPVSQTLLRDAKAIWRKLVVVVCPPLSNDRELRDWDLWGPLILCLILAIILATSAPPNMTGLVFSAVFVLVWVGSAVVTLNAKFLGSTISFFQTVCVMGYCIAPICFGALIDLFIPFFWLKLMFSGVVWAWACWASLRFFRGTTKAEKEMLVIYPVALFYLFMTWMVLVGV